MCRVDASEPVTNSPDIFLLWLLDFVNYTSSDPTQTLLESFYNYIENQIVASSTESLHSMPPLVEDDFPEHEF